MQKSCYNCQYLSKSPALRGGFKYFCKRWGLSTYNVIPQSVVIQSIGKKCPFYLSRKRAGQIKKHEDKKPKPPGDEGLDLYC